MKMNLKEYPPSFTGKPLGSPAPFLTLLGL